MSGWDSHPLDDQKVTKRSNSSLTKDEISAFWRSRQRAMEEHLKEAAAQKALAATVTQQSGGGSSLSTASAVSIEVPKQASEEVQQPTASSPDWWTRSNWAFLNFPPEMLLTDSRDKYTPQFDVAAKASNLNQMYTSSSSFSTTL
jgi:predicted metal-dependent hydrolase